MSEVLIEPTEWQKKLFSRVHSIGSDKSTCVFVNNFGASRKPHKNYPYHFIIPIEDLVPGNKDKVAGLINIYVNGLFRRAKEEGRTPPKTEEEIRKFFIDQVYQAGAEGREEEFLYKKTPEEEFFIKRLILMKLNMYRPLTAWQINETELLWLVGKPGELSTHITTSNRLQSPAGGYFYRWHNKEEDRHSKECFIAISGEDMANGRLQDTIMEEDFHSYDLAITGSGKPNNFHQEITDETAMATMQAVKDLEELFWQRKKEAGNYRIAYRTSRADGEKAREMEAVFAETERRFGWGSGIDMFLETFIYSLSLKSKSYQDALADAATGDFSEVKMELFAKTAKMLHLVKQEADYDQAEMLNFARVFLGLSDDGAIKTPASLYFDAYGKVVDYYKDKYSEAERAQATEFRNQLSAEINNHPLRFAFLRAGSSQAKGK